MRVLGQNRYCVMSCETRAVLCVECEGGNALWLKATPSRPIPVCVELGDYDVARGVYKNSSMRTFGEVEIVSRPTKYKRVCVQKKE